MARDLTNKRDALLRIIELAHERFDVATVEAASSTATKVEERLRHGTSHTVVALAGPTGSGKSSLFNALIGDDISATSVRRPTTGQTHAGVFGVEDATGLLDWLSVDRRHLVGASDQALDGLVLLDLPDHDSTEALHQIEVDRLVGLVDLLVWVTEPQKYADHVMHDRYLRPLASFGDVMVFVVSKIDLLGETDTEALLDDYGSRLLADGLVEPTVIGVSTVAGDGVDAVAETLRTKVREREATVARLEADLVQAAGWFVTAGVDRREVERQVTEDLASELAIAAGSDKAGAAVARQHERSGALATGWPPTRWLQRFGRQPFGDVPVAAGNASAEARVDNALRNGSEATGSGLGSPWPSALRSAVGEERNELVDALGRLTVKEARATLQAPRWWALAKIWQRMFAFVAAIGGGWLLTMAVLGGLLRLDTEPLTIDVPGADWLPVPTALLLGGALLGLIGATLARIANGVGAQRRAAQVEKSITGAVVDVTEQHVISPMNRVLDERNELRDLVAQVSASRTS